MAHTEEESVPNILYKVINKGGLMIEFITHHN